MSTITLVWKGRSGIGLNKHRRWSSHTPPLTQYNLTMNSQHASVCCSPSDALGCDCAGGGWGVQSIYWCGYLVLWQAESINHHAVARLRRAFQVQPLSSGGGDGSVSQAKFDQQMQFPCATAIWDEDDIMWKRANWGRQHRERSPGGFTLLKGSASS